MQIVLSLVATSSSCRNLLKGKTCRPRAQKLPNTMLLGAAAAQVRAMAEAFSALPARVLWKLTPGEAEALGNASLASNVKVCVNVKICMFRVE